MEIIKTGWYFLYDVGFTGGVGGYFHTIEDWHHLKAIGFC